MGSVHGIGYTHPSATPAGPLQAVEPVDPLRRRQPTVEEQLPGYGPAVQVDLSPAARKAIAQTASNQPADAQEPAPVKPPKESTPAKDSAPVESTNDSETAKDADPAEPTKKPDSAQLSPEEKEVVTKLQARDTEVRVHEAAHQSASGGTAGGASFSYQTGPDGQRYAIGGEVSIQGGGGSTPEARLASAQTMRSAALAPASPSSQDMSVASAASSAAMKASAEISEARTAELNATQDESAARRAEEQPVESGVQAVDSANRPSDPGNPSATHKSSATPSGLAKSIKPLVTVKQARQVQRYAQVALG